jgi:hypothetical protein
MLKARKTRRARIGKRIIIGQKVSQSLGVEEQERIYHKKLKEGEMFQKGKRWL